MERPLPVSCLFFLFAGVVFLLQLIPLIGVLFMFMLAMFWSVFLINAGMIGIAIEVFSGKVYRAWIMVPLTFYLGYLGFVGHEQYALAALRSDFDAANAKVNVPFNPDTQVLVFEGGKSGGSFTQNYGLNVVYSSNENYDEGYLSSRIIDRTTCDFVRGNTALGKAEMRVFGFHDGDEIGSRVLERRFCRLSMPEAPDKPQVLVSEDAQETSLGLIPIRKTVTTIKMPSGETFQLKGGVASPLSLIPMPIMGCALNSAAPSWDCGLFFRRNSFTPIISGDTNYGRDSSELARALGIQPTGFAERRAAELPPALVSMIKDAWKDRLDIEVANVRARIADPRIENNDWDVDVLVADTDVLSSLSEDIVTGLEKAARVETSEVEKTGVSGNILGKLIAKLPSSKFEEVAPRISQLYLEMDETHWIWALHDLRQRLEEAGFEVAEG